MSIVHAAPSRWRRREGLRALLWMSPWLVGFAVFFAYPLVATVYFSFHRYDLFTLEFVGLDNYRYFFADDRAWVSIRNTLWMVVFMVPAQVIFALGIAQLLTRVKAGAGFFRTVLYLPSLIPLTAGTVAFVFLMNPSGPVNQTLAFFGIAGPDWFGDADWSKPSLVLLGLWGIGNTMMIFLAALLDVPKHLYEAASIDGAGAWRQFRSITLPTIAPVLMFSAVTGVIYALQYFTQAMIASRVASGTTDSAGSTFVPGYPELSTLTLPQWLFHVGFRDYTMGYACVLALLLFAASMVFTLILLRRFRAFTDDEGGDR
ncbi:multiple sugar transport system permease protein [Streptosporangium becharense]|uniref:Multiple sugar transport system permease protein n=1 Tax=Streptosporangium becharense TaxID=1816182 RepID=A0A7W9ICU3_9ACTN|nr:sugar ABC transporter permease [Streptosporangium becharense]MBB2913712.1 multiple sugar transport system permease protein [Streptosporangium becharense]MBB5817793.1 multiple sugar transport system permease protein [Streptosporangium becharense]